MRDFNVKMKYENYNTKTALKFANSVGNESVDRVIEFVELLNLLVKIFLEKTIEEGF